MIEVSTTAQRYFKRLIDQQDLPGLGLRIRVIDPGTPRASCDLQFCPQGENEISDQNVEFSDFNLYVAQDSVGWLEEATIDFEEDSTGGQLSIRAPNIKGSTPSGDAGLADRVAWILETEINPGLASHGGQVSLQEITSEMDVVLQFGGGCHGCGMVDVTLKEGIEKALQTHFPEIRSVVDATDHSTGENPYYR
ncbi:MAG: NfuA family Fe-S biogenesis protein [Xanthomonadales bacterium]|nr:NfuA family Fe-S biogenesis protein [Gammaproteobacteria bacterium]NNE04589.1 NfuA family Fe-S biogenesis protein [Xanthomonadales bacterium]NNL95603.1 NfuA family Fe-S biogenesis protein [Xanthomonadales bacterium]